MKCAGSAHTFMPKKARTPQLPLRLDAAAPDPASGWCSGRSLPYLGTRISLRLDSDLQEATLIGDELHLPLPPEATPRQIQDAAESWLRARALRTVGAQLVMAARRLNRPVPALVISFASRGGWLQADERGGLRCHWRLIEQPQEVIAQVVARALFALPVAAESLDLFALA
jgi:predicted metal-dependent hydrolase